MRIRTFFALFVVLLTVSSCGGDQQQPPQALGAAAPGIGALGYLGSPSDATRTIEVSLLDELAYDPPEIEVKLGETVTFVVVNEGRLPHEFVLGNENAQRMHKAHMKMEGSMAMTHDEPNAVVVEPGQTKELVWTFSEAGSTLYGCHVPGHYKGGMVGELTVTP